MVRIQGKQPEVSKEPMTVKNAKKLNASRKSLNSSTSEVERLLAYLDRTHFAYVSDGLAYAVKDYGKQHGTVTPTKPDVAEWLLEAYPDDYAGNFYLVTIPEGTFRLSFMKNKASFIEKMADATASLDSARTSSDLESELKKELHNVMTSSDFGFPDDEADEYSAIEFSQTKDGRLRVEVRAEVSFDGLMTISEALDKIVQKYDSDAYFDAEDAGILTAYLSADSVNSSKLNSSSDYDEDDEDDDEAMFNPTDGEYQITEERLVDIGEAVLEEMITARLSIPINIYDIQSDGSTFTIYYENEDSDEYSEQDVEQAIDDAVEDILIDLDSSRKDPASCSNALNASVEDGEEYDDGATFFVAIDGGEQILRIEKRYDKWREYQVKPENKEFSSASYMGYLTPDDILEWLRQDYGNVSIVDEDDVEYMLAEENGDFDDDYGSDDFGDADNAKLGTTLWFRGKNSAAKATWVDYPSGKSRWEGWVYVPMTDAFGDTVKHYIGYEQFTCYQFGVYALLKELQQDARDPTLEQTTEEDAMEYMSQAE